MPIDDTSYPTGLSEHELHSHKCLAKFGQSDTPTAP